MKVLITGVVLLWAAGLAGQNGPQQGGQEIQFWAAGGHSVAGGTSDTGVFNAGLRYGWILTGLHGPGILRGQFEYAVEAVPVFLVFQPANTAYGVGWDPLVLKWNFKRRGRIVPYFELGGGVLFTNHTVPPDTSSVNFTPQAALGFHRLGTKLNWSVDARYLHISDAGLSSFNPGINNLEVRLGIGWFKHP